MKKTFILISLLCSTLLAGAQQFWIENWTASNCAQGCLTYTGPNGTWSVVTSGYNGPDSNAWYFSEKETGEGRGVCGAGGSAPASAHVGFTANSPFIYPLCSCTPDQGATIDDYSGSPSTQTNLRLESPVINCTGKSHIRLSFNYIMGNAPGDDYATVWYFNGASWSLLASPPPTNTCPSTQGLWTYDSVTLPPSADNNANVRIGFNWHNDTMAYADNYLISNSAPLVSFAVDSIVLTNVCPVFHDSITIHNVSCFDGNNGSVTVSVTNGTPGYTYAWSPNGATGSTVSGLTAGTYTVTIVDGAGCTGTAAVTITQPATMLTVSDHIVQQPTHPSYNNGSISASVSGGVPPYTYLWTPGGQTKDTAKGLTAGVYKVCVTDAAGCEVCDSIDLTNSTASVQNIAAGGGMEIYPNPANQSISIVFGEQLAADARISITDMTGRLVGAWAPGASVNSTFTIDISGLANGVYFIRVLSGQSQFYQKFIKQ